MFVNFWRQELDYCIQAAAVMRAAGISTLIYPDAAKMKKTDGVCQPQGIPFVIFVGEDEIAGGLLKVKNMQTGEQRTIPMGILQRLYNRRIDG